MIKTTHDQLDERYGTRKGLYWTLFKQAQYWSTNDLYLILEKGDQMFKFLNEFCYLGVHDLPNKIIIRGCSTDAEMLTLNNGEIKRTAYLVSLLQNN